MLRKTHENEIAALKEAHRKDIEIYSQDWHIAMEDNERLNQELVSRKIIR